MLIPLLALGLLLVAAKKPARAGASSSEAAAILKDSADALKEFAPDFTVRAVSGADGGVRLMQNDPWQIQIGFRRGHCVGVHPATGARVSVPLRDVAERMHRKGELSPTVAGDELYSYLDIYDDGPNAQLVASGKILRKIKKGVKKVAAVAKKVVNNKLVKTLGGMAKAMIPPPFSTGLAAIETGVKVAKTLAKAVPGSKAAKAKPIVAKLAAGQITRPQAEAQAKRIGVSPASVVNTGVALKLRADANRGDPKARALFAVHDRIAAAGTSPAAAKSAAAMFATAQS